MAWATPSRSGASSRPASGAVSPPVDSPAVRSITGCLTRSWCSADWSPRSPSAARSDRSSRAYRVSLARLIIASIFPMGLIWYTKLLPHDSDGLSLLIFVMMVGGVAGPGLVSLLVSHFGVRVVPFTLAGYAALTLAAFSSALRFRRRRARDCEPALTDVADECAMRRARCFARLLPDSMAVSTSKNSSFSGETRKLKRWPALTWNCGSIRATHPRYRRRLLTRISSPSSVIDVSSSWTMERRIESAQAFPPQGLQRGERRR